MGGLMIESNDISTLISSFSFIPQAERVIVKETVVDKVGLIHIPETAKESEMKTNEGYVIAVGEDVTFCRPGDVILYGRYSGAWQEFEGVKYRIMNVEDILAKRKENA